MSNVVPENSALERVLEEIWSYMLFRSEQRYFLSVLVTGRNGSATQSSLIIELNEAELSEYQQRGKPAIDALCLEIFNTAGYFGADGKRKDAGKHQLQKLYAARHIVDFWQQYSWIRP